MNLLYLLIFAGPAIHLILLGLRKFGWIEARSFIDSALLINGWIYSSIVVTELLVDIGLPEKPTMFFFTMYLYASLLLLLIQFIRWMMFRRIRLLRNSPPQSRWQF